MRASIAGNLEMNQYAVTITFQKEYSDSIGGASQFSVEVLTDSILYAAMIVTFLMVILLVLKLLSNIEEDRGGEHQARATENTGMLFSKEEVSFISYGTNEEDLESGKGSCSSSSLEDLYDGKICVICYDDQRNCFFIPCGHCITCETCAKRIVSEEIKNCPICRTIINKVRMLQIL